MAKRRFQPGDMARVVVSRDRVLTGRIVLLEQWSAEFDRWNVRLTDAPSLGVSVDTGRPIITSQFLFRDASLAPSRGDTVGEKQSAREVGNG